MNVAVFLATGFEEVEALTPVDLLRRQGASVDIISVEDKIVAGSHNIKVVSDLLIEDITKDYDAYILPGGPGRDNLYKNKRFIEIIVKAANDKKIIGAICGAPEILSELSLINGKRITCYPGVTIKNATVTENAVEIDGNIITSKGMGTSHLFGLALVKILYSEQDAKKLAKSVIFENYE